MPEPTQAEMPEIQTPHLAKQQMTEGTKQVEDIAKYSEPGTVTDILRRYDHMLSAAMKITVGLLANAPDLAEYNKNLEDLKVLAYASHSFDYENPASEKKTYSDSDLAAHHKAIKIVEPLLKSAAPERQNQTDKFFTDLEKAIFVNKTPYTILRRPNE